MQGTEEFRMESVGTQERASTGVQVGSHEGLNHGSGGGEEGGDAGEDVW